MPADFRCNFEGLLNDQIRQSFPPEAGAGKTLYNEVLDIVEMVLYPTAMMFDDMYIPPERGIEAAKEALRDGATPIEAAMLALRYDGVPIKTSLDYMSGLPVLIAEAVNWAAKAIDIEYYALKPAVFAAALDAPGVSGGWGEDGCFYLYHPKAGTACAHDPWGEIEALVGRGLTWPYQWSGVARQEHALEVLAGDEELLKLLRRYTAPKRQEWALAGPVGRLP